jgi:hypothetical protein
VQIRCQVKGVVTTWSEKKRRGRKPEAEEGYKKEESFLLILDRSVAMVSPEQPQFSN